MALSPEIKQFLLMLLDRANAINGQGDKEIDARLLNLKNQILKDLDLDEKPYPEMSEIKINSRRAMAIFENAESVKADEKQFLLMLLDRANAINGQGDKEIDARLLNLKNQILKDLDLDEKPYPEMSEIKINSRRAMAIFENAESVKADEKQFLLMLLDRANAINGQGDKEIDARLLNLKNQILKDLDLDEKPYPEMSEIKINSRRAMAIFENAESVKADEKQFLLMLLDRANAINGQGDKEIDARLLNLKNQILKDLDLDEKPYPEMSEIKINSRRAMAIFENAESVKADENDPFSKYIPNAY